MWMKLLKWNQGGYDAVYVEKNKNLVRFVQITRGKMHLFKIEYFYNLFSKFRDIFEIQTLEIFIVVPKEKMTDLSISTIANDKMLAPFKGG